MLKKSNGVPLLLAILMIGLSSCTAYRSSVTTAPVNMQLNVTTQDLDFVGEVSGTASQNYVLGIPVGGRRFYGTSVGVSGYPFPTGRGIQNALYDALQKKPDADFLIPFSVDETINQMFLGSKRTYKVRAKAFKLKSSK